MPSGLTAEIYEGKSVSFRRFALKCFTQFGAGYYASNYGENELPLDKAPECKVDGYYFKRAAKAQKELEKWESVKKNPKELQRLYDKEMDDRRSANVEVAKADDELRKRYTDMIEKTEHWDVPEECASLKALMLKQLNESLGHDCGDTVVKPYTTFPSKEEWIEQQIAFAKENLNYANSAVLKQIELIEKNNKTLKLIYEALDKVDPYKE